MSLKNMNLNEELYYEKLKNIGRLKNMTDEGIERRHKLKKFIKDNYDISLINSKAYQLDAQIIGEPHDSIHDNIYDKLIVLYPDERDLEFLIDQRTLLGDVMFTKEFIESPRNDLDQILPSRKKPLELPSPLVMMMEALTDKYFIIFQKDTTGYDKWKFYLERKT